MTPGSQEWSKYPFLIKSNRLGTKLSRSTAGPSVTILSSGISHQYKQKGVSSATQKRGCRYGLIEAFILNSRPHLTRKIKALKNSRRTNSSASQHSCILEYLSTWLS